MTDIKDRLIDILSRAAEALGDVELEEGLAEICDGLESRLLSKRSRWFLHI